MKFDSIIIGGGLSGLIAGIILARKGKRVAIVSTGQSALHFASGSFELLSSAENPLDAMASLPEAHPYSKIGADNVAKLVNEVPALFADAGIALSGNATTNHMHISPLGKLKKAWLSLNDFLTFDNTADFKGQKADIINIKGFTDFYPEYIALAMDKLGVESKLNAITFPEIEKLRKSSTEMRATNMARIMTDEAIEHLAAELNKVISPMTDFAVMPAIIGLTDDEAVKKLRSLVRCPIYFIPTMPSSVPGVRTQLQLVSYFERLGGTFILGDTVTDGVFDDNNRLVSLSTSNLGENTLEANDFVLATGSFFSKGLKSNFDRVYEPVFDLKVDYNEHRSEWYNENSYAPQPYMTFGVATGSDFRVLHDDKPVENLYAVGSVTGGCNPLSEGCGAGVAILTAMHVANNLK